MDPRLPRAIAAMAALVRADMANPVNPEAPTKTVSEATRQAMAVATQLTRGPGGAHAIRSGEWHAPAASALDHLLCAVPRRLRFSRRRCPYPSNLATFTSLRLSRSSPI